MPQQNPNLAQWQQRHARALAAVKAAEATRDQQAIRSAYDGLRQVNTAKPAGQATRKGASGTAPRQGILSKITQALTPSTGKPK